jgi:thiol-disulfide isomerase/thioredoxin
MNRLRTPLLRSRATALPGLALALLALLAAAAAPLAAQPAPDPLFQGFEPTGAYALSIAGKAVRGAEIYHSERARALLLLSSELESPLLVNLRSRRVESVGFLSLAKRPNGTIDILADAEITPAGSYAIADEGVSLTVGGKELILAPRASLTGRQSAGSLAEYDPTYSRAAEHYKPNDSLVAQLRQQKAPVRIQVFFNSKCAVCQQMVPKIIKVERALEGSKIAFDYYGLPDSYKGDAEMDKKDVRGVPTGIVYVDGKEVGRIVGAEWQMPELAIKNVLIQKS